MLSATESVCPVCLRRIAARKTARDGDVYLEKTCPEHGDFRTVLWRGLPAYEDWGGARNGASPQPVCAARADRGCPFDCGLCPEHRRPTCCVVMEVTARCNLACQHCFADAGRAQADPPVDAILDWSRALLASGGPFNLQLSGGEPTLRDDLPEIVALVRSLGFGFVQVNTNGLRLAEEPAYARALKDAGLGCVFLQFDGLTDDVYRRIRGRALLSVKLAAIRNCSDAELGVVLVPTLVPGVNTSQIGEIIRFGFAGIPAIRAVHFQPISYFGRFPRQPADEDRITIPEVLRAIEGQTSGTIRAAHFSAPSAENAWCSFQGRFVVDESGAVTPAANPGVGCCGPAPLVQLGGAESVRRARQSVARHWTFPEPGAPGPGDSLDEFLARDRRTFSISGMAFQDAWNLDLDRLRDCFLHAVTAEGRLVPLCAYNLSSTGGRALYRNGSSHV